MKHKRLILAVCIPSALSVLVAANVAYGNSAMYARDVAKRVALDTVAPSEPDTDALLMACGDAGCVARYQVMRERLLAFTERQRREASETVVQSYGREAFCIVVTRPTLAGAAKSDRVWVVNGHGSVGC